MKAHNSNSRSRRPGVFQVLAALAATLILVFGFASSTAQSTTQVDAGEKKEREIETRLAAHLPIKLKIRKPEKLKDSKNEDWLGDLEVEVINTGTKPIYHLYIALILPEVVTEDGKGLVYQLRYGRAQLSDFAEPVRPDDVPLLPGDSTVIRVSDDRLIAWKSLRARGKVANPKKLQFWFQWLNHGDGTGFAGPDGLPLPTGKERSSSRMCSDDERAGKYSNTTDPPIGRYSTPNNSNALMSPVSFLTGNFFPSRLRRRSLLPLPTYAARLTGLNVIG